MQSEAPTSKRYSARRRADGLESTRQVAAKPPLPVALHAAAAAASNSPNTTVNPRSRREATRVYVPRALRSGQTAAVRVEVEVDAEGTVEALIVTEVRTLNHSLWSS